MPPQRPTSSLPGRARFLELGIRTHKPTCQKFSTNIFTPRREANQIETRISFSDYTPSTGLSQQ